MRKIGGELFQQRIRMIEAIGDALQAMVLFVESALFEEEEHEGVTSLSFVGA